MTSRIIGGRAALVALVATTALFLAACGGSDDDSPSVGAPAPSAPAGSEAAPPAEAPGGCGADVVDAVEQVVASDAVTSVEVIGSCTMVKITTSLAADADAEAKEICEAAAKVAYNGDIMSVSVDDATGSELSVGIQGAPCL